MKRLRKHIAFVLFGIFFFPIIFQSVHILWHHSDSFKCEEHHCHCETNVKPVSGNTTSISQEEEEEHCPICEYEFSLNEIPKIIQFRSIVPKTSCAYNEIVIHQQYPQLFSNKTPRAPPVLIS